MSLEIRAFVFLIVGFATAAAITAVVIPRLRRLALLRGWVDRPDGERKVHDQPVPSVGGVAIACGFLGGLLLLVTLGEVFSSFTIRLNTWFFVGAALTAAVGFYDDVKGVGFKGKFVAQIGMAFFLLHAGYRIDLSWLIQNDPYTEMLYSAALTTLWVVGIMNAVNLIDGLDGLAGGVLMIAFVSLGIIFGIQGQLGLVAIAVVMVGALAAFLAFNYSPASIFMGDTGSLFLGYVVAAFSLHEPAHADPLIALLVPVVVLGLPVLDTTLSIVRRFSRGHSIFAPDMDHLHHRLSAIWAPRRAVLLLYGAAAFFGATAILMAVSTMPVALLSVGIASTAALSVVRRVGYEPSVLVENIKRRFVIPELQTLEIASSEDADPIEPVHSNGVPAGSRDSIGTSADDFAIPHGDGATNGIPPEVDVDVSESGQELSPASVVEIENDITSVDLDGETVVLSLQSGSYFGLNEAASSILNLLKEEPRTVESIVDDMHAQYEEDRDRIKRDVEGFLGQMLERNLIRSAGAAPKVRRRSRRP